VSKQDTHFINVFSVVIGLLVAVAIALFALARIVASHTQDKEILEDASYVRNVEQRVSPFAKEAIAGQDNSALAIKPDAGNVAAGAAGTAEMPKTGEALFQQTCSACHGAGIAGAPKAGDKAAWAPRIAKGMPTLYDHALHGFQGGSGVMPAKGGRTDAPDDLVKQAVDYMVGMSK
jgi:cytochrome c5